MTSTPALTGIVQLISGINDGIIDSFGTGTGDNKYPIPTSLNDEPTSSWWVSQWGLNTFDNPDYYVHDDQTVNDSLYGTPLYNFLTPDAQGSLLIFNDTKSSSGGYVAELNAGAATSTYGQTHEIDFNLTAPTWNSSEGNLGYDITLTLDFKVLRSINYFVDHATNTIISNSARIRNTAGLGFTVAYNGAGGVGIRAGFIQTQLFDTAYPGGIYYSNGTDNMFITTFVNSDDAEAAVMPADANADADTYTINVNKLAEQMVENIYAISKKYTAAQIADLMNLNNWRITGLYLGPATQTYNNGTTEAQDLSLSTKYSGISLTENYDQAYDSSNIGAYSTSVVDTNPQISFVDNSPIYQSSTRYTNTADGAAYNDQNFAKIVAAQVQYEYIYNDYDSISLTTPTSGNYVGSWYFGGGYGKDILAATTGNNLFLASYGGATMYAGSGTDSFIIPQANINYTNPDDLIFNFKAGDVVYFQGVGNSSWTYSISYGNKAVYTLTTGYVYQGLQINVTNGTVTEKLFLNGLQQSDLANITFADDANGNLVLTYLGAIDLSLKVYDYSTGQWNTVQSTLTNNAPTYGNVNQGSNGIVYGHTELQASYFYNGSGNFFAVTNPGVNMEVGGGSGVDILVSNGGNDTLLSGGHGAWFSGGPGDDTFIIQDNNNYGYKSAWSTITGFHPGDTVVLQNFNTSGWQYSWWYGMGAEGYTGATFFGYSNNSPDTMELMTLSGYDLNQLVGMTISKSGNDLVISDTNASATA